jgi:cytochrome P450
MTEETLRSIATWRAGDQLNLSRELMSLTLAIVSRTLFSSEVTNAADEVARAMTVILEMFDFMILPGSRYLERVPLLPVVRRFHAARQQLDRIVRGIIRRRVSSGELAEDLLGLLLSARDEDGSPMSEQQIRDEVLTLFLAGHETTANALAWAFYLLTSNPEVERQLHHEVDQVLAGRAPSFEDFERLDLTRRVFAESLRLYPPAWAIGRRAIEPHTVGGYVLPAGTIFALSPYITHRHPDFWPDPDCFDPARFLPEATAARDRFSYFPFGGGPRVCIGERFAWLEGVLVIAAIAQRWRFRLAKPEAVKPQAVITLRPRGGLPVELLPRFTSPHS